MSQFLFEPTPVPAVPVRGIAQLYPIRRIFCVGRNYEAHAKEMGVVADREAPFYFTKTPLDYVPTGTTLAYPAGTANYHYEMELVVAIGAPAYQVSAADVPARIYGFGCGLDMTRRDLQLAARDKGRPWDLGKDFDQSAVLSPLVRAGEAAPMTQGKIELKVNGVVKQSSDLKLMIHPVAAIIADLSKYYSLQPGDIIYTGTPEGVGPVKSGDVLEGSIEGLVDIAAAIA
jgi:fumarylpyruvate hydrolase